MHKDKYKHLKESSVEKEFLFDESSTPQKEDFLAKKDFLKKQKSLIHGNGIFTTIKIPASEIFYLVPLNDVRSVPTPYAAKIGFGRYVLDEKVLNYVNHSCDANAEFVFEQQRVLLRAKREILPGEEITLDYIETEERNTLVPCNCGKEKCRNFFFIS